MREEPMREEPAFNPYFALISGAVAVSTGAIFVRLADAPALVTAAYRVGLASLVLLPVAWFTVRSELVRLTRTDVRMAVFSGAFLALHFAVWISSLDYTSVANSVVLVNTNPIWVGLFTRFVTGEKISRATRIGIGLSVLGGVIIGFGDFSLGVRALWGDGLAMAGSICAAVYLLIGRNLRKRLSLVAYISVSYGSAALLLWAVVLILKFPIVGFGTKTYAAFLGLALFTQLVGHTSYNWALKWFSAGVVAVSLLGEPVGSTILAYVLFHEGLDWFKALGGLLILSAIVIAVRGESPEPSLK